MCNVKLAVLGRKWGGMEDFCSRSNNETFWWRIAFSWEVTDTRFPRSGTNQTSLTLLWIFTSHCIPMKHEQFHTEPIPVSMNLWPGQSHSVTVKHTLGSGSLRWRPDPLEVGMFWECSWLWRGPRHEPTFTSGSFINVQPRVCRVNIYRPWAQHSVDTGSIHHSGGKEKRIKDFQLGLDATGLSQPFPVVWVTSCSLTARGWYSPDWSGESAE